MHHFKEKFRQFKICRPIITCTEGYKNKLTGLLKKDVLLMPHAFQNDLEINFNEKRDIDIGFLGSLFLNDKLHVGRINMIYNLIKNYEKSYIVNFSKLFILDFLVFIFSSIVKLKFF